MVMIRRVAAIAGCLCVLWTGSTAHAGGRVALLIGNAAYDDARLSKPPQDVALLEKSLTQLHFTSIRKVLDADQKQIQRALRDFGDAARDADMAFFYYSGHGLQSGGENYLVPVKAQIASQSDIVLESVPVGSVMQKLEEAHPKVSVVVLDACRDNPWLRSKGVVKGLERVDAPGGTLVAYATSPNTTAADEGLYARYLAQYLVEPGLELRKIFDKVGGQIDKETKGKQRPRKDDGLYEDVYLSGGPSPTLVVPPPQLAVAAVDEDLALWADAKGLNTLEGFEDYLSHFPNGKRAGQARAAMVKLKKDAQMTERLPPVAAGYAVGSSFKDCASGCPELVVIPPGSFMMGSPAGEGDSNEQPQHSVSINYSLAVGRFEVTRGEFGRFVSETGRAMGTSCWGWTKTTKTQWEEKAGYDWQNPGFAQDDRHPVTCVSWEDAQAYVKWLGAKTGQAYRLLSESEWEYVARAGTRTAFSTGNCISTEQANYDGNYDYKDCGAKTGKYRARTVEVGSFRANDFGLYDVHGNVWEWVEDCYNGSYTEAPMDGSARVSCTGENAGLRVLRGGSWDFDPSNIRSVVRGSNSPIIRFSINGFRVARRL